MNNMIKTTIKIVKSMRKSTTMTQKCKMSPNNTSKINNKHSEMLITIMITININITIKMRNTWSIKAIIILKEFNRLKKTPNAQLNISSLSSKSKSKSSCNLQGLIANGPSFFIMHVGGKWSM